MSEKSSNDKDSKICGLCNDNPSKYCCPRCEVYYCSLDCYKSEKHQECSESFYRECVTEELVSSHADDESQRKMIEILKRMHEQDIQTEEDEELFHLDSDDDDGTDLHERIKDLDLNDPDVLWEVLTEDERSGFEALLNDGDIGSIMPQWEPWWLYKKSLKKVEEVGKEENKETEMLKKCPVVKEVSGMTSMTTVKPSPVISFNITNVLASYAFVMRYFNGDVEPQEWVVSFLNICANLDTNTNFEDLEIAVESVAQKSLQSELIKTDKHSLDIMKNDTYLILEGPSKENHLYYCKAALSDLHKILHDAKSLSKTKPNEEKKSTEKVFSKKFPDHGTKHLPKINGDKLKKCMKKVEYYLSFLETYCMEF